MLLKMINAHDLTDDACELCIRTMCMLNAHLIERMHSTIVRIFRRNRTCLTTKHSLPFNLIMHHDVTRHARFTILYSCCIRSNNLVNSNKYTGVRVCAYHIYHVYFVWMYACVCEVGSFCNHHNSIGAISIRPSRKSRKYREAAHTSSIIS